MAEPTPHLAEASETLTDEDLQHIASLVGEESSLYEQAAAGSPDFNTALQAFLSTNRYTHLMHDEHTETVDKLEITELPPITYVNPDFIHDGLRHVSDIKHLMQLYESRTGNKAILMQTDFSA